MSNVNALVGQLGRLAITVTVKRAATGCTETHHLTSEVAPEEAEKIGQAIGVPVQWESAPIATRDGKATIINPLF